MDNSGGLMSCGKVNPNYLGGGGGIKEEVPKLMRRSLINHTQKYTVWFIFHYVFWIPTKITFSYNDTIGAEKEVRKCPTWGKVSIFQNSCSFILSISMRMDFKIWDSHIFFLLCVDNSGWLMSCGKVNPNAWRGWGGGGGGG